MSDLSRQTFLLSGSPRPAERPVLLTAGPLKCLLMEGELRYLTVGATEAVRRIYAAVRDRFWNTIPGTISGLTVDRSEEAFTARWRSEHANGDVDFVWDSKVTGTADGVIRWEFDGVARKRFLRNRIGFCILHPLDTCRNRPCTVEHVSGEVAGRTFPDRIAPDQPVRGLHDFRSIRYGAGEGVEVEVAFEGDVFEMEDQRNWTDASFKTYSTPQRIPLPGTVEEGQRIRQVVTVSIRRQAGVRIPAAQPAPLQPAVLAVQPEVVRPVPAIGLGAASHGRPLTEREGARLRDLNPGHLRTDVKVSEDGWRERLAAAVADAGRIGVPLEIALHLPQGPGAAVLQAVVDAVAGVRVARWLVVEEGQPVVSPALAGLAREVLRSSGAPVGAGTDIDFFQLNNNRPAAGTADFIFCSLRPQAHNFDDAAVIENLVGQAHVVETAREVFGLPFFASPVTLRRRWFKGPPPPEGELPPTVDPRQMSLLGAGWLTGSIRTLALAGAAGATFFETTGWRGIMETAAGSPLPDRFPSVPGGVFPMYHVLRAVADFRDGQVVALGHSNPLAVQGILLQKPGARRLIAANVTPDELPVTCTGLEGSWSLRILDEAAAAAATSDPGQFRATPGGAWDGTSLRLPPYSLAFADSAS